MKVTRKQVSIVALSMATFVVLAGVLLYFQFREPRHGGKSFSEWAATLESRTASADEMHRAFDAILVMGPGAIPWLQDSLAIQIGAKTRVEKIRDRLPAWVARHFFNRPTAKLRVDIVCMLLRALEPDGATTLPLLLQSASLSFPDNFKGASLICLFHPPADKVMPQVDQWMKGGDRTMQNAAIRILANYPEETRQRLPALEQLLSDYSTWLPAMTVIASCGPAASNLESRLEAILRGPAPERHALTAYVIARISPGRTAEMAALLSKKLTAGDVIAEFEVVRSLRAFGAHSLPALPGLLSRLGTASGNSFSETVAAIGAIGPAAVSAVEALRAISEGRNEWQPSNPPDEKARIEALIAIARIDPSQANPCGERLAQLLRADRGEQKKLLGDMIMDTYDPERFVMLLDLLGNKADDIMPSLAFIAWMHMANTLDHLKPILTRIIEHQPVHSPLREEAERALKLIAPGGSEKNQ